MDADNIPEEKRKDYKNAFEIFDKNKDGKISKNDLENILRFFNINPSKEELNEMITEIDLDGDNNIEFEEFIIFMNKRNFETNTEDEILNAFKAFEKDIPNCISVADFEHILNYIPNSLTKEEIEEFIKSHDEKDSGYINYKDLIEEMKN